MKRLTNFEKMIGNKIIRELFRNIDLFPEHEQTIKMNI